MSEKASRDWMDEQTGEDVMKCKERRRNIEERGGRGEVFVPSGYTFHANKFNLPVQVERSGLEEVCKGKDEVLAAKEQEVAAKERALSDERQRVSSLTDECATLKGMLEGKTEEIESLQAHVNTVEV